MVQDATEVYVVVFPVSFIGRQSKSGRCEPKEKRKRKMQREREVQWYKAYRRVIFMQSLLANNSRQICLFQLQQLNKSCSVAATEKKQQMMMKGNRKVSIEPQPN